MKNTTKKGFYPDSSLIRLLSFQEVAKDSVGNGSRARAVCRTAYLLG